jgi:hypothetical protein
MRRKREKREEGKVGRRVEGYRRRDEAGRVFLGSPSLLAGDE